MKQILVIIMSLLSQVAFAGDASEYESLGFSKNGKYYAYIQDGFYDGSGAYWIELGIIDVKSNAYVGRKTLMQDMIDDQPINENEIPKMLRKLKKQLSFDSYGFPVKTKEKVLISRPHNDLSTYANSAFTLEYWPQGGASSMFVPYEVLLNEVKAVYNGNESWCWYENSSMIELRLKVSDPYSGTQEIKDLQIDTHQPESRYCSFGYSVSHVMNSDKSIAIVLKYSGPGFEGPDNRYMVVTGIL